MENSLIWRIDNNSYIMGTIHVYDPEIINIPEEIYGYIDDCNIVALELANISISFYEMLKFSTVDSEDYSLENYLSPTAFQYLMEMESIGGRKDLIDKYKPLFITNLLLKEYSELDSIESKLHEYALNADKIIVGLEEVLDQIKAVDAIPLEVQAEILEDSLLKGSNPLDELGKMMQYYSNQDIEKIKSLTEQTSITNQFMENMQEHRNVNMANRIDEYIPQNALFVAIGALHLPDIDGKKGVISLLRDKGHTVEPITLNFRSL